MQKQGFYLALISLMLGSIFHCSPGTQEEKTAGPSELVQPRNWWENLPRPIYAELKRIETAQDWYEVYQLTDDTWAIYEPYQFEEAVSYLLIGTEKAILIDTGTGIGDLRETVEPLTELPLAVVNTHTHWDHIGDNAQFQEIACHSHPECIAKLESGVDKGKLVAAVSGNAIWKGLPPEFDLDAWEIPPVSPTLLLEDGDIIDLGERKLEVIHTPGHSPGSICLLDPRNRLLFTGDVFFPGPLYAYPEDVDIQAYIASITKLVKRLDEYDILCSGHNDPWVKSEVIPRVERAFAEIMEGGGEFQEDEDLRRYRFQGFDILIRADQISGENLK
jgi:glyoxylase-like metal-dependent hydrolase (beta-lactamase superfamily II)